MNLSLLLIAAAGYVIGTFPTAYVLLRISGGGDITKTGSGNVGARNIYEVSGKKWLGVTTMAIDALKGALVVYATGLLFGDWFAAKAFAAVGAVVGHNYNVFLKGKGGRGLATALGVGLAMNPLMVITWGLMYLIGYYVFKRDIAVGSMAGTIATAVMAYSLPDLALDVSTIVPYQEIGEIRLFVVAMMAPVFMKFLNPLREVIRTSDFDEDDDEDEEDVNE